MIVNIAFSYSNFLLIRTVRFLELAKGVRTIEVGLCCLHCSTEVPLEKFYFTVCACIYTPTYMIRDYS